MRKIQHRSTTKQMPVRNSSHANFSYTQTKTIAEINHVSAKQQRPIYSTLKPFRILLPNYFNIPKFIDEVIVGEIPLPSHQEVIAKMRAEIEVKKKMKDLQVLAMGMHRAKSIKEQSRYYFTQGVLLHNSRLYHKSIQVFQKFLKIVLFIRDEKSVQLALNAIGAQYMHLKDYNKAIQYHKKQGEINSKADQFASHINLGLCYELLKDNQSALSEYYQAKRYDQLQTGQGRKMLVKKLIQRAENRNSSLFVTSETPEEKCSYDPNLLQVSGEQKEKKLKSNSVSRFKKDSRIQFAIQHAQQKLQDYLTSMKNSFIIEKN